MTNPTTTVEKMQLFLIANGPIYHVDSVSGFIVISYFLFLKLRLIVYFGPTDV